MRPTLATRTATAQAPASSTRQELRLRLGRAVAVFELVDRYALERGTAGPHPQALGRVRFFAYARRDGRRREPLEPPLELMTRRNPSGFFLFFGQVLTPDGVRTLEPAVYSVAVRSEYYQGTGRARVPLPPSDRTPLGRYRFRLRPGYLYPFPDGSSQPGLEAPTLLRGEVLTPDGRGVANARIYAWRPVPGGRSVRAALFAYRTDASGQWVLVFPDELPRGEVRVRVRAPGQPTVSVLTEILPGRTNSLRQTSLTGAVLYESGVPVEDGRIQVEGFPGRGITDAGGRWSYTFPLDMIKARVTVRVTHPQGAQPPERSVEVIPRSTVHVPVFEAPNPPAPIPTIKENRHA